MRKTPSPQMECVPFDIMKGAIITDGVALLEHTTRLMNQWISESTRCVAHMRMNTGGFDVKT